MTPPRTSEGGFTLVELLISLLIIGFALAVAAQVLMETSQMMVDAAAEQTETALPLARARLRADIQACRQAMVVPEIGGRFELWLLGHPAGTVRYRKAGRELRRDLAAGSGLWEGETVLLRNVEGWGVLPVAPGLVGLEFRTLRRGIRRSPLPALPGRGRPGDEALVETLVTMPRGGGRDEGW